MTLVKRVVLALLLSTGIASAQPVNPGNSGPLLRQNNPVSATVLGTGPNGDHVATPLQGAAPNVSTFDNSSGAAAGNLVVIGQDGGTTDSGVALSQIGVAVQPGTSIVEFGDTDAVNSNQYFWTANTVPTGLHVQASSRSLAQWAAAFTGYQLTVNNAQSIPIPTRGYITNYWLQTAGSGYGSSVTLSVPDCPGAVPTATVSGGILTAVSLGAVNTTTCSDGVHAVTVSPATSGTPAVIWASVPDAVGSALPNTGVTGYYVQNGGTGYSTTPGAVTAAFQSGSNCGTTHPAMPGAVTVGTTGSLTGVILSVAIGDPGDGNCTPQQGYLVITDSGVTPGSGAVVQYTSGQGGSYGGLGEDSNQMLARINDVLSSSASIIVIHCCTVDVTRSPAISLDTTKNNLRSMVTQIAQVNKIAILVSDSPRASCTTANTTINTVAACGEALTLAQQLNLLALDEFKRSYVTQQQTLQNTANDNVLYLGCGPELTDQTTAGMGLSTGQAGGPILGTKYDGEHLSAGGAAVCGYKLATLLSTRLGLPMGLAGFYNSMSPLDMYDPINNFTGALNTNPNMLVVGGVQGTMTGSGCSGSLGTGWSVTRSDFGNGGSFGGANPASTATVGCSLTSGPRSDGYPGNSEKAVLNTSAVNTASLNSSTADIARFTFTYNTTATALGISPGDVIQPQALMEISGTSHMNMLSMRFYCLAGAGNAVQALYSEWGGNQSDLYMDSSYGAFTTAKPFLMRALPTAVPPDCTGSISLNMLIAVDAATLNSGATAEWSGFQVRKLTGAATPPTTVVSGCGNSCTVVTTGTSSCSSTGSGGTGAVYLPYTGGSSGGGPAGSDWTLKFCDDFQGNTVNTNKWAYNFNNKPSDGNSCLWNTFTMNPSALQTTTQMTNKQIPLANLNPSYVSTTQTIGGTNYQLGGNYQVYTGMTVTDNLGYIPSGTVIASWSTSTNSARSGASIITLSKQTTAQVPTSDVITFTGGGYNNGTHPAVVQGGGYVTFYSFNNVSGQCGYEAKTASGTQATVAAQYDYSATGYPISQGALNSRLSYNPLYGYFESAIQFSGVGGPLSSGGGGQDDGVIMYPSVNTVDGSGNRIATLSDQCCVEIDAPEVLSANSGGDQSNTGVWNTVHWGTSSSQGKSGNTLYTYKVPSGGKDLYSGFHVYGVDWEPTFIKWYIDGILETTYTGANIPANPMEILLLPNTCGTTVNGWCYRIPPSSALYPHTMKVEWARGWQHAGQEYIGVNGPNGVVPP